MKAITRVGILGMVGALALTSALAGAVSAQQPSSMTYTAELEPVPLTVRIVPAEQLQLSYQGTRQQIAEEVSGLAATFMDAPYPHVQHIHGGANGACPTASADSNGDGVVNTVEGQPAYGEILTTLSVSGETTPAAATNVEIAPSGGSFDYNRTITLDDATLASLRAGTAVIVVHGLDPATAAPAATSSPSELVPSLPLAATSPALCGVLTSSGSGPAPTATPAGGSTMRPPTTGDGGLLDDGRTVDSDTRWHCSRCPGIGFKYGSDGPSSLPVEGGVTGTAAHSCGRSRRSPLSREGTTPGTTAYRPEEPNPERVCSEGSEARRGRIMPGTGMGASPGRSARRSPRTRPSRSSQKISGAAGS